MAKDPDSPPTASDQLVTRAVADAPVARVRRLKLLVVEGPSKGTSREVELDRSSVGSHPSNDLVIDDETVSRFHCEIVVEQRGVRIRDLDSKNGTILDGVPVLEAFVRGNSLVRLGHSTLRVHFGHETNELPQSEKSSFGSLVGASRSMRTAFAQLERAASADATVLIEGETGTGKEGAAEAIHEHGARAAKPFVVVDCSAIPGNLLESELFGHERGSFTGAAMRRIGAFEEAHGGTIFLDEVGELPSELQPKLLRVLEQREVRRIGSNTVIPIDVRVIAATNRDLRAEVNAGRFRADLYFRLAVLRIVLPSLRARPDDVPALCEAIVDTLGATAEAKAALLTPSFLSVLQHAQWPGNVRELRNHLERCLVFQEPLPVPESAGDIDDDDAAAALRYEDARRQALDRFERSYVQTLLRRHQGKVEAVAKAAGVAREYVYRLMRRHGLKSGGRSEE